MLDLASDRSLPQPKPFSPQNLTLLIRQCDALSIHRNAILDTLAKRAAALPEKYVEDVFENVLLPLVHSLCLYLHELSNDRPLEPAETNFVSQTIKTYFERHVAKPRMPPDWTRDIRINCHCDDCRKLQRFARDPRMEREKFPVSTQRRHHLHCQLDGTSFEKETTRNGLPNTLHVWKTNSKFEDDSRRWEKKLQRARSWLAKFVEKSHLIEIIGNETYQELRRLSQAGATTSVLPPMSARSLNVDAQTATMSRKRSYVDLTVS